MLDRARIVVENLSYYGTPYLWGAKGDFYTNGTMWLPTPKDPARNGKAFALDCSGSFLRPFAVLGGPDRRKRWTTDDIWALLEPTDDPRPGDAALYEGKYPKGPDDVEHVMMVIARVGNVILVGGASGGGHATTSYEAAARAGACYKLYPTHLYRSGFRGFRSANRLLG